jgi:hypothetical protein
VFTEITATNGSGQLSGAALMTASIDYSISNGFSTVAGLYNLFKYLPGTMFHYVPQVSMSTSGIVYTAFIDNPEIFVAWHNGTTAERIALIRGINNCRTYPIWQQFSWALTEPPRRRMFDCNATMDVGSVDALDRSWQGAWLYAVDGAPATSTVARAYRYGVLQLEGLTGSSV